MAMSTPMSTRSAANITLAHASSDPIYIDPATPFYVVQPAEEISAVVAKEQAKVRRALGDELIDGPYHMGSSTIKGMPCTPVVDLACSITAPSAVV